MNPKLIIITDRAPKPLGKAGAVRVRTAQGVDEFPYRADFEHVHALKLARTWAKKLRAAGGQGFRIKDSTEVTT